MHILSPRASSWPALLLLLLACSVTPGCSVVNGFNLHEPTATFRSVAVSDVSAAGLSANFDVDVHNPNSVSLPVSGASYKLSLSGVQVVDDQAKPTGAVPGNGALPVTVPVRLRFDQLLSAEQAIVKSGGNVPFEFIGGMEFDPGKLGLGSTLKVPLHFTGTLPLRDAISAAVRDPTTLADLLRDPSARKFCESILGKNLLGGFLGR